MKHPATRYTAIKCAAALTVLIVGTAANAANYNYTEHYVMRIRTRAAKRTWIASFRVT